LVEKRLALVYSLSGVPDSNDYTLTIKNLNRDETNNFKELISKLNKKLKKEKSAQESPKTIRLGDPPLGVEIHPSVKADSKILEKYLCENRNKTGCPIDCSFRDCKDFEPTQYFLKEI